VTPLRVCIDARLAAGMSGGVEQVVIGLATGLSKLTDGDEEYFFLTHPEQEDWIKPYLGQNSRILRSKLEYPGQGGLVPTVRRAMRERVGFVRRRSAVLHSDGGIERAGIDVVHFPMQEAFVTEVPSVYQPHDLQHLHLPEMFSPAERERREIVYRTHCERAALVSMMTSWGKRDVIKHYGLPESKVAVVTWGSILSAYPAPSESEIEDLRARLSLPDAFLLYPAQTWPHKNHEGLLAGLAQVRERYGIEIPVVCPGRQNDFFPRIRERMQQLRLESSVLFPGFVESSELRALYSMARGLVFPSLFEGWGMPVTEAFASDLPVASSSATGLPDVVGDAGLIFDPHRADQIADAIHRLWEHPELRAELVERGRHRAELFSVDHSVELFRAHYRQIAGKQLADPDRILVSGPPLA
jgi:glycosyltransferase involved in cell wall biosynthesis